MRTTRQIAIAAIALALLGAGAGAARLLWGRPSSTLPVASIGGDFTLTDHNGAPFNLTSLRGTTVLVFFGYTSCPDVCPTTLSKLTTVSRRLGTDRAKVKTLYISVDPDRDTPDVLKEDLSGFDLDAIGLTGPRAEVDRVVKMYDASYEIVPLPQSAMKYSVSHSTTLYALDAKGRVRIQFPYEATADEIVDGIRKIIAEGA